MQFPNLHFGQLLENIENCTNSFILDCDAVCAICPCFLGHNQIAILNAGLFPAFLKYAQHIEFCLPNILNMPR